MWVAGNPLEALLKTLLLGSHGAMAYLSIFAVLVACGLGVPLPEDISLILGGFLVYKGVAHLWGMVAVGFVGILVGDSLIYLAGRRVGLRVRTGHGWLAPGALVVVERATRSGPLTWPAGYTADRARTYGEATLWYGRAAEGHTGAAQSGPP